MIDYEDISNEKFKNDSEVKELINMIYNSPFADWEANRLSAWSHQTGSP